MLYEYCVIGNGLIGASVALELAHRSGSVCVLGAAYGDEGRYYSSHEDDSRIARCWHKDAYWEDLAQRNIARLQALTEASGLPIFRRTPVFYNYPSEYHLTSACAAKRKSPDGNPHASQFDYEDIHGGIIEPKIYIAALNQEARKHKAEVVRCVVKDTHWKNGRARISTSAGEIHARRVVDARGIFFQSGGTRCDAAVAGKIVLFVESTTKETEPFCFVDGTCRTDAVDDMYGIMHYKTAGTRIVSKFGFSEHHPVQLHTAEEIAAWFQTGYRFHPQIQCAMQLLKRYCPEATGEIHAKPCAFVTTPDARPILLLEEQHGTITGCNGMAAKCCQALAEKMVQMWNV